MYDIVHNITQKKDKEYKIKNKNSYFLIGNFNEIPK